MTSARTPLPTDLVALVSFDGRVYPNEARPLEGLGLNQRTRPLEEALEQWFSFATGKHTWVSVRGATIRGLVSARRRAKPSAWEVEVLINASDDEAVALSLLSRMTEGVIKQGAERVFLRLEAGSDLVRVARRAGFFKYGEETLYRREGRRWRPSGSGDVPLRSKGKSDAFGIYQLYNAAVPANVRAIEGATFREWQAAQEKWGGRTSDLLLEEGGLVTAWLRVMAGSIGRLYALSQSGDYDALLATALDALQDRDAYCLVPQYNAGLASALARAGFEPAREYVTLAKRLTRPVEELASEQQGEAVPVG